MKRGAAAAAERLSVSYLVAPSCSALAARRPPTARRCVGQVLTRAGNRDADKTKGNG